MNQKQQDYITDNIDVLEKYFGENLATNNKDYEEEFEAWSESQFPETLVDIIKEVKEK